MADSVDSCTTSSLTESSTWKNLVLCFDGTDNTFGPDPFTNVLKIFRMLESNNDGSQMCYYQPGIGTSVSVLGTIKATTRSKFVNTVDSMFAFTLDHHIISAYLFLMEYYEVGDKIFMFGFSRGAFTARVLTGMLERVGLLKRGLEDLAPMAWKLYEAWEYAAQPSQPNYTTTLIDEFRNTFGRNIAVRVHFEGLFDSVNSCGIIRDRLFPYTSRSGIVDHVRHAVSIDERRGKLKQQSFSPNPYTQKLFSFVYRNYIVETNRGSSTVIDNASEAYSNPIINSTVANFRAEHPNPGTDVDLELGIENSKSDPKSAELLRNVNDYLTIGIGRKNRSSWFRRKFNSLSRQRVEGTFQRYSPDSDYSGDEVLVSSDLIEKWFPGDHSDVGGGWAPDMETEQFISDLPLRWILSEAIKYGVFFKKGVIRQYADSYTSAGSLLSATHDMLSWHTGHLTMRSPFALNQNPSKKDLDKFRGLLKVPKKVFRALRGKHKSSRYGSTEQEDSGTVKQGCVPKLVKNNGHGSKSIFQVILWWVVELIAIGIRLEDEKCRWKNVYVPNLGRHRNIPEYGEMHWSVYWRCKFVQDYRPSNLPAYAADLIEEYLGIELLDKKKRKGRSKVTAEALLYPSDQSVQNQGDSYTSSSVDVEIIAALDEQQLQRWIENSWKDIPDDLEQLLQLNPDL
ncbi:HDL136Cp [Eremothecium sinecaudum]|uniref:HDL136Cp n=1 Tax=Eremothecium sinecaudum TaxID=45286 RepID=A0A109UYV7_9SACH|nr:HDL136Cp [Eremothecium sinecaudum]AMD20608.1 HDL136Cp [Eremothecium sinecaudum]